MPTKVRELITKDRASSPPGIKVTSTEIMIFLIPSYYYIHSTLNFLHIWQFIVFWNDSLCMKTFQYGVFVLKWAGYYYSFSKANRITVQITYQNVEMSKKLFSLAWPTWQLMDQNQRMTKFKKSQNKFSTRPKEVTYTLCWCICWLELRNPIKCFS